MPRNFFVGGNFKLNPSTVSASESLIDALNSADLDPQTEVVIAPPSIYLIPVKARVRNGIKVSAQNCYYESSGAFTGELSPTQLVDAGISYVVLGHSERRTIFLETSEFIAKKTKVAIASGLRVILCIGETLVEREASKTKQVCEAQLKAVIDVLKEEDWSKIVIAYEPVWAIGTGKVATAGQAQEAQADVRSYIARAVSPAVANNIQIVYGGSVNAKNCKELVKQQDVDGFFVGGASLKPEFVEIINSNRA